MRRIFEPDAVQRESPRCIEDLWQEEASHCRSLCCGEGNRVRREPLPLRTNGLGDEDGDRHDFPADGASVISVPKSLDHGGHGKLSDLCVKGLCSRGHRQVHPSGILRLFATEYCALAQSAATSEFLLRKAFDPGLRRILRLIAAAPSTDAYFPSLFFRSLPTRPPGVG